MFETALPNSSHLKKHLLSAGFREQAGSNYFDQIDLKRAVEAGISRVYNFTGRRWQQSESLTLTFGPPQGGQMIDLGVEVSEITSITLLGRTLTNNTDYVTYPQNALVLGKPIRFIKLNITGLAVADNGLTVVCKIGRTQIPTDVWTGMLDFAVVGLLPTLVQAITGGLLGWSETDGTKEQYGITPLSGMAEFLVKETEKRLVQYKEVRQG